MGWIVGLVCVLLAAWVFGGGCLWGVGFVGWGALGGFGLLLLVGFWMDLSWILHFRFLLLGLWAYYSSNSSHNSLGSPKKS